MSAVVEGFASVDVDGVGPELARMHDQVVSTCGRVEIVGEHGETSVVISKAELSGLERAIELLSNTDGVRDLAAVIRQVIRDVANDPRDK